MLNIDCGIELDCEEYCLNLDKNDKDLIEVVIEKKKDWPEDQKVFYAYISIEKMRNLVESELW